MKKMLKIFLFSFAICGQSFAPGEQELSRSLSLIEKLSQSVQESIAQKITDSEGNIVHSRHILYANQLYSKNPEEVIQYLQKKAETRQQPISYFFATGTNSQLLSEKITQYLLNPEKFEITKTEKNNDKVIHYIKFSESINAENTYTNTGFRVDSNGKMHLCDQVCLVLDSTQSQIISIYPFLQKVSKNQNHQKKIQNFLKKLTSDETDQLINEEQQNLQLIKARQSARLLMNAQNIQSKKTKLDQKNKQSSQKGSFIETALHMTYLSEKERADVIFFKFKKMCDEYFFVLLDGILSSSILKDPIKDPIQDPIQDEAKDIFIKAKQVIENGSSYLKKCLGQYEEWRKQPPLAIDHLNDINGIYQENNKWQETLFAVMNFPLFRIDFNLFATKDNSDALQDTQRIKAETLLKLSAKCLSQIAYEFLYNHLFGNYAMYSSFVTEIFDQSTIGYNLEKISKSIHAFQQKDSPMPSTDQIITTALLASDIVNGMADVALLMNKLKDSIPKNKKSFNNALIKDAGNAIANPKTRRQKKINSLFRDEAQSAKEKEIVSLFLDRLSRPLHISNAFDLSTQMMYSILPQYFPLPDNKAFTIAAITSNNIFPETEQNNLSLAQYLPVLINHKISLSVSMKGVRLLTCKINDELGNQPTLKCDQNFSEIQKSFSEIQKSFSEIQNIIQHNVGPQSVLAQFISIRNTIGHILRKNYNFPKLDAKSILNECPNLNEWISGRQSSSRFLEISVLPQLCFLLQNNILPEHTKDFDTLNNRYNQKLEQEENLSSIDKFFLNLTEAEEQFKAEENDSANKEVTSSDIELYKIHINHFNKYLEKLKDIQEFADINKVLKDIDVDNLIKNVDISNKQGIEKIFNQLVSHLSQSTILQLNTQEKPTTLPEKLPEEEGLDLQLSLKCNILEKPAPKNAPPKIDSHTQQNLKLKNQNNDSEDDTW
jgi:hypothetical protein